MTALWWRIVTVVLAAIPAGVAAGWIGGVLVTIPVLAWLAYWAARDAVCRRFALRT